MNTDFFLPLINLFVTAAVFENMALYYFLGTCPIISVSESLEGSVQMGVAVTAVMVLTASVNNLIYRYILVPLNIEYLYLLFFILSIAAAVQLLESFLDRFFPEIYAAFGIFLSLIAVNCAILGVAMFAVLRDYNLLETAVYAFGSGAGWTFVMCIMASLRRRINMKAVPAALGKVGISMIVASVLAMAFAGVSSLAGGGIL